MIFVGCNLKAASRLVRVLQINLFRQNAHSLNFRYFGHTLQRALDQVGKVIQLPIRIAVAGHFCDPFFRGLRIANDNGTPRVGMKVVLLQLLLDELLSIRADFVIRLRRRKIDPGTASDGLGTNITRESVPLGLRSEDEQTDVQ